MEYLNRYGRLAAVTLGMAIAVAGCGGGDDDNDNDSSSSETKQPPSGFNVDGAHLDESGFSAVEVLSFYGRVSADAILVAEANDLQPKQDTCSDGSGTRTVSFTDMDSDGVVSAGDMLVIDYDGCGINGLFDYQNGAINETVTSVEPDVQGRKINVDVTFDHYDAGSDDAEVTLTGGYDLIYRQHKADETNSDDVAMRISNEGLNLDIGGASIKVGSGSSIVKSSDFVAGRYSIEFNGNARVGAGGESNFFSFHTLAPDAMASGRINGKLGYYPDDGLAEFSVPSIGSKCVLIGTDDKAGVATPVAPAARFANGSDDCLQVKQTELSVSWTELLTGLLFIDNDVFSLRGGINAQETAVSALSFKLIGR